MKRGRKPIRMYSDQKTSNRRRPRRPKWLSKDAIPVWKDVIQRLDAMGVLEECHGFTLVRYCESFAWYKRLIKFLDENGETVETVSPGGIHRVKQRPESHIATQLSKLLLTMEEAFGLTPVGRSRIHIEPPSPPDPMDNLLRRN